MVSRTHQAAIAVVMTMTIPEDDHLLTKEIKSVSGAGAEIGAGVLQGGASTAMTKWTKEENEIADTVDPMKDLSLIR